VVGGSSPSAPTKARLVRVFVFLGYCGFVTQLSDVVHCVHDMYPPYLASEWDSVGVMAGRWNQQVSHVLLTVDVTEAVLDEAIAQGCDGIVAHHPVVMGRAALEGEDYKFRLINRALQAGVAIMAAHTNADHALNGVSDALIDVFPIQGKRPLWEFTQGSSEGTGRYARLESPLSVGEIKSLVRNRVPGSNPRSSAEDAFVVSTIAVCGGAGDSLLPRVRELAVDLYLTSDLRHHPVQEHREAGGCHVMDIDHAAAERLWLKGFAIGLRAALQVDVSESAIWTSAFQQDL
jgi:dinuclear metal center YbgI/SA1388 family protein